MIRIQVLSPEEWAPMAEDAHKTVFGTVRAGALDVNISYALLLVEDPRGEPLAYVTVQEQDEGVVYWKFGGSFPPARNRAGMFRWYETLLSIERQMGRKRIYTFIENDNLTMLRMAAKAGFRIVGTRNFEGRVLVDHALTF